MNFFADAINCVRLSQVPWSQFTCSYRLVTVIRLFEDAHFLGLILK